MEMRLGLPSSDTPPYNISLVLLLDPSGISAEADEAIDAVCHELRMKLKPEQARLRQVTRLTPFRMSVELYRRTSLLDLDAYTYDGDQVVGAEPLPIA